MSIDTTLVRSHQHHNWWVSRRWYLDLDKKKTCTCCSNYLCGN